MQREILKFPKRFFWGAGTSAYQVEGGNNNDWSMWEKENAGRLAKEAKNYYQKWQQEKFPEMFDAKNYISGRACDHYSRFEEDFDIAKSLGHNSHRFSIEWSRIEPEQGKFDEKEVAHYRKVIKALKSRGIEPFITLWHYTHPLWFHRRGGWLYSDAEESFLRFVRKVVSEYKNDVRFWITFNEPETYVRQGFIQAIRPPRARSIIKAFKVIRKFARLQKKTYDLIHAIADNNAQVGFAESLVYFDAYNNLPHNLILKRVLDWWRNKQFVPKIIGACDFIGLNYYLHSRVRLNPFVSWKWFQYNENKYGVSDMNWELYPEGIYYLLKDLGKYKKPIYITENGMADAKDEKRGWFIKETIKNIHRAIQEDVDVRGYLHWSFMDNFEWSDGFWPRFGLVEVDYQTLERRVRSSAWKYKEIIKKRNLLA